MIRNGGSIAAGFQRLDATRRQATKLLSDQPAAAGPIADIIAAAQQMLIAEEEALLRREHMLNQRLEQSFHLAFSNARSRRIWHHHPLESGCRAYFRLERRRGDWQECD